MKQRCVLMFVIIFILGLSSTKKLKNKSSNCFMSLKISPNEISTILTGYKEAFKLCHENFIMERWNCPIPKQIKQARYPISLSTLYPSASKETSYVYSLVAANIAYHIIRACQMGTEGECCRCNNNNNALNSEVLPCQQSLKYGFKRGKVVMKTLDYKNIKNQSRKDFNWKNTLAGFQALREDLEIVCRCFGMTGHCTAKKCWKTTPVSLKRTSLRLKDLYQVAKKIDVTTIKKTQIRVFKGNYKIGTRSTQRITSNSTNLVYLDESPNYCVKNKQLGIRGTLNRECDHYNDKTCDTLCSSCGYRKHSFVREIKNSKCNCKFHWCCKVTCQECTEQKVHAKCALPK